MKSVGKQLEVLQSGYIYTPDTGGVPVFTYRGVRQQVYSVASQLELQKIPFSLRNDGLMAEVETRVDPLSDNKNYLTGHWEIDGRPEQVSIFQHPKYLSLPSAARGAIQQLHQGKIQYTPEQIADGKTLDEIGHVTLAGDALAFYTMVYAGQTHYSRTSFIARHSMVASSRRETALSGENVGHIYTTEQLQNEAESYNDGMVAIFKAELSMVEPYGPPVDGYLWGWLKSAPTVRIIAGDRVECSVEYWFDNWPLLLYPAV